MSFFQTFILNNKTAYADPFYKMIEGTHGIIKETQPPQKDKHLRMRSYFGGFVLPNTMF